MLQSGAALDNVLSHVRDGGTVAAGGGKWAPPWALALNAGILALHSPSCATSRASAAPGHTSRRG